jgi:hypothetical protein
MFTFVHLKMHTIPITSIWHKLSKLYIFQQNGFDSPILIFQNFDNYSLSRRDAHTFLYEKGLYLLFKRS